jgi:hypothetical protein
MRISTQAVIFLIFCCLAQGAIAEKIYRSVDKKGEVTFSDEPPPAAVDVEQIEVQPAPTEAEHREGMERMQRMESQANKMGAERTPPPPGQFPEEVQPTENFQNYDDGYGGPYDRGRPGEVIRNRGRY